MSSKLHQLVPQLFIQSWRPLANYAGKAGVVCLQVKLCDPYLSALDRKTWGSHDEALYKSTFIFTFIRGLLDRLREHCLATLRCKVILVILCESIAVTHSHVHHITYLVQLLISALTSRQTAQFHRNVPETDVDELRLNTNTYSGVASYGALVHLPHLDYYKFMDTSISWLIIGLIACTTSR